MFDKDNKFGFINNNESNNNNSNNIKNTDLPYTISSKKLATVPASDVKLDELITVNNASINKDRRYYIEFLGSKKLCGLLISEDMGNSIVCSIGNYVISANNDSTNISVSIDKINADTTTTDTFTDLIIHEEEVKCLDSKYIETDLTLQNSISLGRIGNIGVGSSAIGNTVEASGDYSHAEGSMTIASGISSHAEGDTTTASGDYSHAEGSGATAIGEFSHAEGATTTASGFSSHVEGYNTIASSDNQHVQGKYNIEDTEDKYTHIVGNGTDEDARSNAHTLDWNGNAWFAGEVQGTNLPYTISSKKLTTVPASSIKLNTNITVNNVSINKDRRYYIEFLGIKKLCNLLINKDYKNVTCSIGKYNIQAFSNSANMSVTVGKINADDTTTDTFTDLVIYEEEIKCLDNKYLETDLVLQNSISLGRQGIIGIGSNAIGYNVEASGNYSHAEGNGSISSANTSHAEGSNTKASGDSSHAEGGSTTASGHQSHAEGSQSVASGQRSHAEGECTVASGYCSHVEGESTIASGDYQHAQGQYNIEDTANKYAHIVGNGTDEDARSNAHTLDWQGNGWYAGKLSQEGTPTEDKDLTTKKYVDDKVSSLPQFSFNESGELVVTINGVSKTFVPKNE